MGKRATVGLLKGLLIGGLIAFGVVQGLGVTTFGVFLAYALAVATGVLTALLAGRPVWARGARVEAAVKSVAGALLAAGVMFALRKWADITLDLSAIGAGVGALSELPAVALPLVATVLALVFELDNTGDDEAKSRRGAGKAARAAKAGAARARVDDHVDDAEAEMLDPDEAPPKRRRRR